jgi:hypothetical protein
MTRRRHLVIVPLLAAVPLLSSCSHSSGALGGGARVDVCGAYVAYDSLPEPDPADGATVQRWTAGFLRVIDRTDTDREGVDKRGHQHNVPADVANAFPRLRDAIGRYQAAVRAASARDAGAIAGAADRLALDDAFVKADITVRDYYTKTCQ